MYEQGRASPRHMPGQTCTYRYPSPSRRPGKLMAGSPTRLKQIRNSGHSDRGPGIRRPGMVGALVGITLAAVANSSHRTVDSSNADHRIGDVSSDGNGHIRRARIVPRPMCGQTIPRALCLCAPGYRPKPSFAAWRQTAAVSPPDRAGSVFRIQPKCARRAIRGPMSPTPGLSEKTLRLRRNLRVLSGLRGCGPGEHTGPERSDAQSAQDQAGNHNGSPIRVEQGKARPSRKECHNPADFGTHALQQDRVLRNSRPRTIGDWVTSRNQRIPGTCSRRS